MDIIGLKRRISEWITKYKYVWIVLLAGIVLMLIPERTESEVKTPQSVVTQTQVSMEDRLAEILCHVKGAGQVKVMLSIAQGERTIYQTDSTYSQGENNADSRTQTILITDRERNETGLVHQKNPPIYQGAIVLAQGAENPTVKLAIIEAVSDVTGLGADRITVLKMQ